MEHEKAFLAAVLAEPEADAPRLMYADFLDERGDPTASARAELVRVQCAIAASENYPGERFCQLANGLLRDGVRDCLSPKCRPCKLRRRQAALLKRRRCDWEGDVRMVVAERRIAEALRTGGVLNDWREPAAIQSLEFRRGFIEVIECTAEAWLAHGDALVAVAPLRQVRLTTAPIFIWGPAAGRSRSRLCNFPGRKPAHIPWLDNPTAAWERTARELLSAGWDKIDFELPT